MDNQPQNDHALVKTSTAPLPAGIPAALPATITDAGEEAARYYVEFFTVHIRNKNNRKAYARIQGPKHVIRKGTTSILLVIT
jgi:hypothetical protein